MFGLGILELLILGGLGLAGVLVVVLIVSNSGGPGRGK
jgi:hypothetical protein